VISIEVRALDAEGQFLPVSAPGADASLQLVFSSSPYGRGSGRGRAFPMAGRDSILIAAGELEDFAASVASTVPQSLVARDFKVTPVDARVARAYIGLKTALRPISDLGFYDANTTGRLLLIYFDRACALHGTVKWARNTEMTAEIWNVGVGKPGLQWLERTLNGDGTYSWNLAPPDVVPMIISSPSVIDYSQTEVPGIERAAHSVQLAVAHQGEWIAARENCKLWNANPSPNESVTWSGACKAGYGEGFGVMEWSRDGEPEARSEVTLRHGKSNGPSSERLADGTVSVGTDIDGSSYGRGTMTWPDGSHFEGNFVHGAWTGAGVWTGADGSRYEGQGLNWLRDGKGTFIGASGERYDGHWKAGAREGLGIQTFADGGKYEGSWLSDKPSGHGTRTWPDGSHYTGEFINGNPAHPELIVR
jgi:hypothetical protein